MMICVPPLCRVDAEGVRAIFEILLHSLKVIKVALCIMAFLAIFGFAEYCCTR